MTKINKHGLKRNIPSRIKRQIRQECGFGCIICGNAIYQYEHIIPEFNDAKTHDVDKIGLLCGSCHDKVTRGFLPKEHIQNSRLSPFCLKDESSNLKYFINPKDDLIIELGNIKFINTFNILVIDSCNILSIITPEIINSPPMISANFYDRNEKKIAWINNNEWFGDTESFDIETVGSVIKIRSDLHKIDLNIKLVHPNTVQISKLNLHYKGNSVSGTKSKGFSFKTKKAQLYIGHEKLEFNDAPFGISILNDKILVSNSDIINFTNLKGQSKNLSGYYEIEGGLLRLDSSESGTTKLYFESDKEGNSFNIKYNLPKSEYAKFDLIEYKKQRKSNPCRCGSKKIYEFCCEQNIIKLNKIINSTNIFNLLKDLSKKHKPKEIYYEFKYNLNRNSTWLNWQNEKPNVFINTSKSYNESNIAETLICWDLIKEKYIYLVGTYQDFREDILSNLQGLLLSIPIMEKLKLGGFEISRFYEDEISYIKTVMKKKITINDDRVISKTSLFESIKILRLEFNTDYLSHKERKIIKTLFINKSPIAIKIEKLLLKIINSSNLYNQEEYNKCLLKCATLINNKGSGMFNKFILKLKENLKK